MLELFQSVEAQGETSGEIDLFWRTFPEDFRKIVDREVVPVHVQVVAGDNQGDAEIKILGHFGGNHAALTAYLPRADVLCLIRCLELLAGVRNCSAKATEIC